MNPSMSLIVNPSEDMSLSISMSIIVCKYDCKCSMRLSSSSMNLYISMRIIVYKYDCKCSVRLSSSSMNLYISMGIIVYKYDCKCSVRLSSSSSMHLYRVLFIILINSENLIFQRSFAASVCVCVGGGCFLIIPHFTGIDSDIVNLYSYYITKLAKILQFSRNNHEITPFTGHCWTASAKKILIVHVGPPPQCR